VSRVINRTGLVTAAKRQAVEQVLTEVNFIPNNAARALASRRSRTVGLIVPTLANPVFAPTIDAVEATLAARGYALLIACSHRAPEAELAQARTMIERGVEGLILTGSYRHPALMPLVAARQIPAVSQDDPVGAPGLLSLALPDAGAMEAAIDHLAGLGHRRIGLLSGPVADTPPIAARLAGARARLAGLGLDPGDAGLAVAADYSAEAARAATRGLLSRLPGLTAIACTGDIPALGAVVECTARGLRVPDDISVTGCGETMMAQYVHPRLTTVRLPFADMGARAATRLLERIEANPAEPEEPLGFALVAGETTRAPR